MVRGPFQHRGKSDQNSEELQKKYNGALRVRVPVRDIHVALISQASKRCALKKLMENHITKDVWVEGAPEKCGCSVRYCSEKFLYDPSEKPICQTKSPMTTQFHQDDTFLFDDDNFHICIEGMSARPYDLTRCNRNELLMYSMRSVSPVDKLLDENYPIIHYNHVTDSQGNGTSPDEFVPIPSSKKLFMAYDGSDPDERSNYINCRFKIVEVDRMNDLQGLAISGLSEFGNIFSRFTSGLSQFGFVGPAVSAVSSFAKEELQRYSKADQVLSVDFGFFLSNKHDADKNGLLYQSGKEFLRCGYYFFLSKPINAKLYAHVGSSSQNISLMMRRVGRDNFRDGEKEYIPLSGVNYLVISVKRGVPPKTHMEKRKPVNSELTSQLDNILQGSVGSESDFDELVRALKSISGTIGFDDRSNC